jgi:CRP/FNR family transcriptional regulator, cyclic AMP receptor protein
MALSVLPLGNGLLKHYDQPLLPSSGWAEDTHPQDPRRPFLAFQKGPRKYESSKVGAFLNGLSREARNELDSLAVHRSYENGSILFSEGEGTACLYVVTEGAVKLSMNSSFGRRLTLRLVTPGQVLGLTTIVLNLPHDTTAEAIFPCRISCIRKEDFLNFLSRHPDSLKAAMSELSTEHAEMCEKLRLLSLNPTAPTKLAHLLLNWGCENGVQTNNGTRIRVFLSHEEIGEFIGASRETVTRTFAEFKHKRLIEQNGSTVTITDEAGLASLAEA